MPKQVLFASRGVLLVRVLPAGSASWSRSPSLMTVQQWQRTSHQHCSTSSEHSTAALAADDAAQRKLVTQSHWDQWQGGSMPFAGDLCVPNSCSALSAIFC